MVRDIQKILETLQEQEKKQNTSKLEIVHGCVELATMVKELGANTSECMLALDKKIDVIKEFIIKQAEKTTELQIKIIQLEDKLNAKN
tara:strand:- start:250 stop:513 length:264 start_codon:yes stop_codon:yes gene_type:complete